MLAPFLIAPLALAVAAEPHPRRLAHVREIQSLPGIKWKAAVQQRFASEAPGASKSLCGLRGDWQERLKEAIKSGEVHDISEELLRSNARIPDSFDSASQWPQCAKIVNDVRDQSNCGCCWAFAGAEAASDRMCIATNGSIIVPLSTEDICFNSNSDGCSGGDIHMPWIYVSDPDHGAVTGGQNEGTGSFGNGWCSAYTLPHCHHHGPVGQDPYPAEGQPGCLKQESPAPPTKCDAGAGPLHSDFEEDKYMFKGKVVAAQRGLFFGGVQAIQRLIMAGGPVSTGMSVYEDFENYASGVYHHVSGDALGGHAVKIVGWGVEDGERYWKVANSWNPYWGENGFFRIRFKDCDIDQVVIAAANDAQWGRKMDLLASSIVV